MDGRSLGRYGWGIAFFSYVVQAGSAHGGGVWKLRYDGISALYVADVDGMPCICAIVARVSVSRFRNMFELDVE